MAQALQIDWLGRVAYGEALRRQQDLHEQQQPAPAATGCCCSSIRPSSPWAAARAPSTC